LCFAGCLLWAAWLVYRYWDAVWVAACSVALVWAGGRAGGEAAGWGNWVPNWLSC